MDGMCFGREYPRSLVIMKDIMFGIKRLTNTFDSALGFRNLDWDYGSGTQLLHNPTYQPEVFYSFAQKITWHLIVMLNIHPLLLGAGIMVTY